MSDSLYDIHVDFNRSYCQNVLYIFFPDMNRMLPSYCSDTIIDPAAIFAMLFGSELFEEYIGQLAMASMASQDIFTEGEQFDTKKLQEKMRV